MNLSTLDKAHNRLYIIRANYARERQARTLAGFVRFPLGYQAYPEATTNNISKYSPTTKCHLSLCFRVVCYYYLFMETLRKLTFWIAFWYYRILHFVQGKVR